MNGLPPMSTSSPGASTIASLLLWARYECPVQAGSGQELLDAALMAQYGFVSGWYAAAGYRTLEGGANNDDICAFAWLHYAQVSVGRRF